MSTKRSRSSARIPLNTTTCPDCKRSIGVQPIYNHSIMARDAKAGWRLAPHGRERGGPRCSASRMFIDPSQVKPKETPACSSPETAGPVPSAG